MTPIQFARMQLDMVLRALRKDECPGLRDYVVSWLHAGKDYRKWVIQNPPLAKRFRHEFEGLHPVADFDHGQPLTLEGDVAAFLFATLLANPLRNELRRCPECGKYFRTGDRRKFFCTRRHLLNYRAQHAVDIDRAKKLLEADRLLESHGTDPNWKEWLSAQPTTTGITKTWLAWQVKRGYIDRRGYPTKKNYQFLRGLQEPLYHQRRSKPPALGVAPSQ